jgi:hypothetical protein
VSAKPADADVLTTPDLLVLNMSMTLVSSNDRISAEELSVEPSIEHLNRGSRCPFNHKLLRS